MVGCGVRAGVIVGGKVVGVGTIVGVGVTMGVGEADGREHPSTKPSVTAVNKYMNVFDMQEDPTDFLCGHSSGFYLAPR